MKRRIALIAALVVTMGMVAGLALALSEAEPNNSPAQANPLAAQEEMEGAIEPVGDLDYYALEGLNTFWGFIALLETDSSTTSQAGTLTAYGSDGVTVLQSDTGSWEHGSGIALQNYADGGDTHYLRVNEEGDDATVTSYTLRYYSTVVLAQPATEPNDTPATGTPSGFTHEGALASPGDVDCFAFHGRAGDTILVALDGDPEGDGSPANLALALLDPSETILDAADITGLGGQEFIEETGLASEGVYAYCVSLAGGAYNAASTYRVGLVRNGGLYLPAYEAEPAWLNPRPGGYALITDTLSFRLAITNTSPVEIPGDIDLKATYDRDCLEFVDASLAPTAILPGDVRWVGLQSGLAPGEVYEITANFLALARCADAMHQSTTIDYYFTGQGSEVAYFIAGQTFLPLILRE